MKSTTSIAVVATGLTFLCVLASVASTPLAPVEPIFALELLDPYEACLFTCNFCFTTLDATDKLLQCSNQVCSTLLEGKCAIKEFIWLGRHCDLSAEDMDRLWTGGKPKTGNKGYKLH